MVENITGLSLAQKQDAADELASFRDAFVIREPGLIYLDGNSLGRLTHRSVERIRDALIEEMDVLPDFREPDNIRLGLAPLYTSFTDVWHVIDRIRKVVEQEMHLKYPATRLPVT